MATWPATLPQVPLLNGFSEEIADDAVIRSSVSAGTPKTRPRYSSVREIVEEDYLLDRSQFVTFKNFFKQDLRFGSLRFDKPDPIEQTVREYRFVGNYSFETQGPYILISISLEKFPQ